MSPPIASFEDAWAIAAPRTLLTRPRAENLWNLHNLSPGFETWECGVYKGGASLILALSGATELRLFDTFSGHPADDDHPDGKHVRGSYADTSPWEVEEFLEKAGVPKDHFSLVTGRIPDSFSNFDSFTVGFAHLDLDLCQSTEAALRFIWPRLAHGGIIVCDDYSAPECPGVREAVDSLLRDEALAVAIRGAESQAVIFKAWTRQISVNPER